MIIVGNVKSKEEATEITFIAKLFLVEQRARVLGGQSRQTQDKPTTNEQDEIINMYQPKIGEK